MRIGNDPSTSPAPALTGWMEGKVADGTQASGTTETKETTKSKGSGAGQDQLELSPDALQELSKLKARDQQVRAHEAAHMAAGGALVRGGARYTYQRGPDGGQYAVGGEVTLDTSAVPNDPKATILKAQRIQAAAMAPADPSGQDRSVAAQAQKMAADASAELAKQSIAPSQSQQTRKQVAAYTPGPAQAAGGLDLTA